MGNDERVLWVPERRFALLVSLLAPPDPLQAGDDVPDEIVLPQVWPRQPHKSRVDLNVLVARLRKDLEAGGASGSSGTTPTSQRTDARCFQVSRSKRVARPGLALPGAFPESVSRSVRPRRFARSPDRRSNRSVANLSGKRNLSKACADKCA